MSLTRRVWTTLLAGTLTLSAQAQSPPPVFLLRSQNTFHHLGWRARWDWLGAHQTLVHLGLRPLILEEEKLADWRPGQGILILANARNLSLGTLQAVRDHLAAGGKLVASYQTSYRRADNGSWAPNGLALGPELGVRFTRWNGTPGETSALRVAPPYGQLALSRHQAMLVEALPGTQVLAHWDRPAGAPAIVSQVQTQYWGEDLLAPENSQNVRLLGLVAGLFNSLEPQLRLRLPRSPAPLLEPDPPFFPLPGQSGEASVRVGLGSFLVGSGSLRLQSQRGLRDAQGQPLGTHLLLEFEGGPSARLMLVEGGRRRQLPPTGFRVSGSPYLHCWRLGPEGTARWGAWRGVLEFQVREGNLEAINHLPLDGYLAGVLPSEVPFSYPPEALKAMAVVARTYALSHLSRHQSAGYDLCSEVHCQVYRGLGQEHPRTTEAILQTRNLWLASGNQPIQATFHACCGGHGSALESAWGGSPRPYLRGRFDQPVDQASPSLKDEAEFRQWLDSSAPAYCSQAGRFRWRESYSWSEFEEKLKLALKVQGKGTLEQLEGLEITRRDAGGRVLELSLRGRPQDLVVGGDSVRWLTSGGRVGSSGLPSNLFYLDVSGYGPERRVLLTGGGWGHGVGMCQEGAAGRARAGQDFRQILMHYYGGADLSLPAGGSPSGEKT